MNSITRAKDQEIKRNRAWEMHINGVKQWDIADALGVTQARVSQLIKNAAKAHPINQLSLDERMAISEERWNLSEKEMRDAISEQLLHGRVVTKTTTDPYGKVTTEVTHQKGVDPALLRALSTHHDRRARQLNNQMSPDASMQAVQVNVVKDFIQQGESQGRLSAEDWNQSQAVDV
ncbi:MULTISPECIES: TrfB-related DNA-binding protein [Prochlorococcus]|uniref:TrfB-related DNA-binding protein n=1 Tax=Prochlorococcus TaxID=1218 RepID=UPI0007B3B8EE|nr:MULTISPECIES: TrfB-related DNA-binding protein [Prochlorococcus]KZR67290.1 hypothetical protein PMIT1312_00581 [Prochlorococcus marinus str. MIT 1312]